MSLSFPTDQGFSDRALHLLRRWPALTVQRADHGTGTALALRTHQIVHFHGHDEAEVRLTRPVMRRMTDALQECGHANVEPGGDWVRVRLASPTDLTFLISLVSVAIKANTAAPHPHAHGPAPCPGAPVPTL